MSIPERDWKKFRKLKPIALERFCEGVVQECERILAEPELSAHDRYLKVFRLMRKRDRELAGAFDGHSRSKALMQLVAMRQLGVIDDDELRGLTAGTRRAVEGVVGEV